MPALPSISLDRYLSAMDPIDAVSATRRSVRATTAEDGREARAVVAERTYPPRRPTCGTR